MRKISLSKPYIPETAIDSVVDVLKSGWITQGARVCEFENNVAKFLGVEYAIAVNSATAGLHASLVSLGIAAGDEVILPSFTWVSTANVVEMCGAKVVFADIDSDSYNVSEEDILSKITPKTKAVIPVHLFGSPFNVSSLKKQLPKSVFIVEDAACALGSKYNKFYAGTQGDIGVFSFHPRKSITTGEGGMIVTNNESLYQKILMLRNHGQSYCSSKNSLAEMSDCPVLGYNYRITDIQAALGISQLNMLDEFIGYRKNLAKVYFTYLSEDKRIKLPFLSKNESHSWQSFVVSIPKESRNHIIDFLTTQDIETRPGTHAVHNLSYYKNKYNTTNMSCPNAYEANKSTIALPMHNHLTEVDIKFVSDKLLEAINARK